MRIHALLQCYRIAPKDCKQQDACLDSCDHQTAPSTLQVLVIAVLMKYILQRKFALLQWEALLLLCIGITTNQLDHCM